MYVKAFHWKFKCEIISYQDKTMFLSFVHLNIFLWIFLFQVCIKSIYSYVLKINFHAIMMKWKFQLLSVLVVIRSHNELIKQNNRICNDRNEMYSYATELVNEYWQNNKLYYQKIADLHDNGCDLRNLHDSNNKTKKKHK